MNTKRYLFIHFSLFVYIFENRVSRSQSDDD